VVAMREIEDIARSMMLSIATSAISG